MRLWIISIPVAARVLKVRLYRPWIPTTDPPRFPATTKAIAVLDRTRRTRRGRRPLYLDVLNAFAEASSVSLQYPVSRNLTAPSDRRQAVGWKIVKDSRLQWSMRYSKTSKSPNRRIIFTIGINGPVPPPPPPPRKFFSEPPEVVRAVVPPGCRTARSAPNKESIARSSVRTDNYTGLLCL